MTQKVAQAFDAATEYDANARIQREAASWLADLLVTLAPSAPRIMEIGCGTGFVGMHALPRLDRPDWLMTDIADAMIARARARFSALPGVRFARLDGQKPDLPGEACFDLVCSSLAAQWFDDLAASLDRLLALVRPGGSLILTTLSAGTFAEWQRAHADEGLIAGTPDYPDLATLEKLRPAGVAGTVERRTFLDHHADTAGFLRALRAIGAGTPRAGHRPLGPAALRRVARRFEAAGSVARYEVALCRFDRPVAG